MLNASSEGFTRRRKARLVTAGLAPYGDEPGGSRTRPLGFWREVFCLKTRKLKRKKRCGDKARFDVFAHHPINTSGPPKQGAVHPDDASSGDLPAVRRVLRAAERQRTVEGRASTSSGRRRCGGSPIHLPIAAIRCESRPASSRRRCI